MRIVAVYSIQSTRETYFPHLEPEFSVVLIPLQSCAPAVVYRYDWTGVALVSNTLPVLRLNEILRPQAPG